MTELGVLEAHEAEAMRLAAAEWTKTPGALMILPLVLEIIAERV